MFGQHSPLKPRHASRSFHELLLERFILNLPPTSRLSFISRRGVQFVMYSDNACKFRYCARLFHIITASYAQNVITNHRVQWNFMPERVPWWGRWWDRIIRTAKDLLNLNLGRKTLTYEDLLTPIALVEAANSRPPTFLNSDPEDAQSLLSGPH